MQAETKHHSGLPEPDPDSLAHSQLVAGFLRARIAESGGYIGFAEFMQHALHAPGLGYYAAGSQKFGTEGDFVTAPELSPLFGRVLGRQIAQIQGETPDSCMLELGAGSGALAVSLLKALETAGSLPWKYLILEPSPDLQSRQRQRLGAELPGLLSRVEWIDDWPVGFVGTIIANEVADSLPFARFVIRRGEVNELCVAAEQGGFAWVERKAPSALLSAVRQIEQDIGGPLPDGYVSEVCLALPGWTGELADSLHQGCVFLFDYGLPRKELYARSRDHGWLRCHFRNRAHDDPLIYPGIQDLTTWVDFSVIADAAASRGMLVAGFVTQAHFLLHGGLQQELANFSELPQIEQTELSRQVKLLTLPGEMGEHFKCIGLSKGLARMPAVFESSDRAHTL